MTPHSSILAWKIPWMEKPGGLPSMGSHSQTRLKRLSSSKHTETCESLQVPSEQSGPGKTDEIHLKLLVPLLSYSFYFPVCCVDSQSLLETLSSPGYFFFSFSPNFDSIIYLFKDLAKAKIIC